MIGSHTYAAAGSDAISVTIVDSLTGNKVTANSTASVSADTITLQARDLTVTPGRTFQGIVATFTDSGPAESADGYHAVIRWGKGHRSAGTITGS